MPENKELTHYPKNSRLGAAVALVLSSLIAGASTATGFFIFGASLHIASLVCLPAMYVGYAIYTGYMNYQKEEELIANLHAEIDDISDLIGENRHSKTTLTSLIKTMHEKINAKDCKLHKDELRDFHDKIVKLQEEVETVFLGPQNKAEYKAFLAEVLQDTNNAILKLAHIKDIDSDSSSESEDEMQSEASLIKRMLVRAKQSPIVKKISSSSRLAIAFFAGALTVLGICVAVLGTPVGTALMAIIFGCIAAGIVLAALDHYAVRKQEEKIRKLTEKNEEFGRIEFRTNGFHFSLAQTIKLVNEREKKEELEKKREKIEKRLTHANLRQFAGPDHNPETLNKPKLRKSANFYINKHAGLLFSHVEIPKNNDEAELLKSNISVRRGKLYHSR